MKLKYDELLSKFALNCNLRHYSAVQTDERTWFATLEEEDCRGTEWWGASASPQVHPRFTPG